MRGLESLLQSSTTSDDAAEMAALVRTKGGIRAVATPAVRTRAGRSLEIATCPECRHVATRLHRGGIVEAAPSELYIGVPLLCGWDNATAPNVVAATAIISVAERFDVARRLPEIAGCGRAVDFDSKAVLSINELTELMPSRGGDVSLTNELSAAEPATVNPPSRGLSPSPLYA